MKRLIIVSAVAAMFLFSLSAPVVMAQLVDFCEGNFDYDQDMDGTDASVFKSDFGRSGLINPCPPDGPAPVPKAMRHFVRGIGDDAYLNKGVAWPNPRFTDNGDGTIKDNLTGLIWLKNANCFGGRTWYDALSDCNGLLNGSCGLSDGSSAGDWRLANRRELESLIDTNYLIPALCDTAGTEQWSEGDPFDNVQSYHYWSSTTYPTKTLQVWYVNLEDGGVGYASDSNSKAVWPVRGGH